MINTSLLWIAVAVHIDHCVSLREHIVCGAPDHTSYIHLTYNGFTTIHMLTFFMTSRVF